MKQFWLPNIFNIFFKCSYNLKWNTTSILNLKSLNSSTEQSTSPEKPCLKTAVLTISEPWSTLEITISLEVLHLYVLTSCWCCEDVLWGWGKEAGGVEEHFRSSENSRKGYGSTGNHHTGADQSERLQNIPVATTAFRPIAPDSLVMCGRVNRGVLNLGYSL